MITVPGYLLLRNLQNNQLLVGFDDPERGLTLDRPVWLNLLDVGFEPFSEFTGEFSGNRLGLGFGNFRMSEDLWRRCPDLVAADLRWQREDTDRLRQKRQRERIFTPTQAAKVKERQLKML